MLKYNILKIVIIIESFNASIWRGRDKTEYFQFGKPRIRNEWHGPQVSWYTVPYTWPPPPQLGISRSTMAYLAVVVILSRWFSEHWNVIDNDDNDASLEGCEQEYSSLRALTPYHIPPPVYCRWCLLGYEWVIADVHPAHPNALNRVGGNGLVAVVYICSIIPRTHLSSKFPTLFKHHYWKSDTSGVGLGGMAKPHPLTLLLDSACRII
jgi:hypothetical protein